MARHPTARRVHRDHSDPDDAFLARVLEISEWAKRHGRILTTTGMVVVLGLAAGLYYRNYRTTVRAQAETQLATVRQTVTSGNSALAIKDLEDFVSRYDGTRAAEEARLVLTQAYLDNAQPQKALEAIEPLAQARDHGMGTSAQLLEAAAFEANGQPDSAETLYLQVADNAEHDFEKQDALDAAARIRMDRGDAAGAAELYERALTLVPENSPEHGIFQLRLAEARAKASATS